MWTDSIFYKFCIMIFRKFYSAPIGGTTEITINNTPAADPHKVDGETETIHFEHNFTRNTFKWVFIFNVLYIGVFVGVQT